VLVGCGTATGEPSSTESGTVEGGDEPTTPAALAWVAAEHLGDPDSASAEDDIAEELGNGALGAELRFGSDGEYDGDLLVVAVGTAASEELVCTPGRRDWVECVETARGTVLWEDETPEEDPGNVLVTVTKGEVTVLVFQAGPAITDDPRELDLPISVEDMFAIAEDPRVDLTTSREAVEAGADATYWQG